MPNLKYLFTSFHQQGNYISQTQSDVSQKCPGRNTFFDVLEEIKNGNNVLSFCLINQEDPRHDFILDLRDGSFIVNGNRFFLHDIGAELTNFRLIFYKTRKEHFTGSFVPTISETIYHLGWQANDKNGNNIQHILNII